MEKNLNIQNQPDNEPSEKGMDVQKINVNIIDGGRDGSDISKPKKENKLLKSYGKLLNQNGAIYSPFSSLLSYCLLHMLFSEFTLSGICLCWYSTLTVSMFIILKISVISFTETAAPLFHGAEI